MTRRIACTLPASFVCFILLSPVSAQPWPQFHGSNGDGVGPAVNLPADWSGKDFRWKIKLEGAGHSSPVVWGKRVFVTSATEESTTLFVQCFEMSRGVSLWRKTYPLPKHAKHQFNSYASSTPCVDEEHLYVTWATPQSYLAVALKTDSGNEVWRRDLGPFASEHGFGPSPVAFEDLVIVANDQDGASSIVALDRKNGQIRWQSSRKSEKTSFATPYLYRRQGETPQLIASSWANGITSLDPRSGKVNWQLPVFHNRVVGSPMAADGLIFAAAGIGGRGREMVAVLPGPPDRPAESKVAYDIRGSIPYVPTPVASGSLVFLWDDQGVVACLDAPTGKVRWRERVGGDYFGSPVRAGDRLYCISRDGKLVILAAAETYKLLAKIDLGERSHSTPAVSDGLLLLRTASQLMAAGTPSP